MKSRFGIFAILILLTVEPLFADQEVDRLLKEFKVGFGGYGKASLTLTENCQLKYEGDPLWQFNRKTIIDNPSEFRITENLAHADTAYFEHGKDTLLVRIGESRVSVRPSHLARRFPVVRQQLTDH